MPFDMAIRVYLDSFRLPGEAQKINRVMESFGARYHMQCPDLFQNPDVVYILAYSTIMLNTDQHNSQVSLNPQTQIQNPTLHHHAQHQSAQQSGKPKPKNPNPKPYTPPSCSTPISTTVRWAYTQNPVFRHHALTLISTTVR